MHGTPKLADFGTASVMTNDNKTLTAGDGIGSACWMAPEVCENVTSSKKSDIYSLGIILYEIFIGEALYAGMQPMSILMGVVKGQRPPIPQSFKTSHPDIVELIELCWAQDSNARPSAPRPLKEADLRVDF